MIMESISSLGKSYALSAVGLHICLITSRLVDTLLTPKRSMKCYLCAVSFHTSEYPGLQLFISALVLYRCYHLPVAKQNLIYYSGYNVLIYHVEGVGLRYTFSRMSNQKSTSHDINNSNNTISALIAAA
jgi:hypothetical protein